MRQAQRGVTLFLNAFAFSSSVVIHRVRQQTLAFEVVLNANTVLCNQQPCNNASSYPVTGTAHHSHECTMTTAQRSTWKDHSHKPLNATATCNLKKKSTYWKSHVGRKRLERFKKCVFKCHEGEATARPPLTWPHMREWQIVLAGKSKIWQRETMSVWLKTKEGRAWEVSLEYQKVREFPLTDYRESKLWDVVTDVI